MPRALYLKDSIARAPSVQARASGTGGDDAPPAWVKATFRPAKAKLDAITVEYGLYQGKFWLPRANSATASMQLGFVRTPFSIDEKFTYENVNGDFSLAAIPAVRIAPTFGDSAFGTGARGDTTVLVGGGVVAGAATGAAIGIAVAGPVGVLVGATLGAVAGAVGGAAAGATANPTDSASATNP